MNGIIALNLNEDTHQIEQKEKNRFLKNVLEQLGLPVSSFWANDEDLSIKQLIDMKSMFLSYSIQIIDEDDGAAKIYAKGKKVAEWIKPTFKIKKDLQEKDRKKQFFIEMEVNYSSIFDK